MYSVYDSPVRQKYKEWMEKINVSGQCIYIKLNASQTIFFVLKKKCIVKKNVGYNYYFTFLQLLKSNSADALEIMETAVVTSFGYSIKFIENTLYKWLSNILAVDGIIIQYLYLFFISYPCYLFFLSLI